MKSRTARRLLLAAMPLTMVALVPACGGGDDYSPPPPPVASGVAEANAAAATLATNMARSVVGMASLEAGVVIVLNPGSPLAPGVTVAPDPTPGAPPNSFTFMGSYDGIEPGTTLNGRVTFVNDPTSFTAGFNGAQGDVSVGIDILGGMMQVYRGNVAYTMGMAEHRVSGSSTFTNPLTATTTTMTVNPAQPLTIKVADGTANARGPTPARTASTAKLS